MTKFVISFSACRNLNLAKYLIRFIIFEISDFNQFLELPGTFCVNKKEEQAVLIFERKYLEEYMALNM